MYMHKQIQYGRLWRLFVMYLHLFSMYVYIYIYICININMSCIYLIIPNHFLEDPAYFSWGSILPLGTQLPPQMALLIILIIGSQYS